MNASDVVILDYYRIEALCCRMEEERVLKVLSGGGVVKIDRICREVGAVMVRGWDRLKDASATEGC